MSDGGAAPMTPADDADHVLLELGLYVLDALSPADAAAVEEHLARCPACRTEADELAEVRAALDLLTPRDIEAIRATRPDPTGSDRTAAPRKRRRWPILHRRES